jgi:hypothetical protein
MMRWQMAEKKASICSFAKQKLLDGQSELTALNGPGSLESGLLSVRFALEFDLADGDSRTVARKQIVRLYDCVAATTGFETLVTIARTELLLAQTAQELMDGTNG